MKRRIALLLATFFTSQAAFAVITFNQLADNIFVVSHRIKVIGSRARAMQFVYEKAASLCVAAGYEHYALLDQESDAAREGGPANASIRIQLFHSTAEGRLDCERNANPEYVAQAASKLAERGYVAPEKPAETGAPAAGTEGGAPLGACTIQQVAAMARAGLSDEQIQAACPDDG